MAPYVPYVESVQGDQYPRMLSDLIQETLKDVKAISRRPLTVSQIRRMCDVVRSAAKKTTNQRKIVSGKHRSRHHVQPTTHDADAHTLAKIATTFMRNTRSAHKVSTLL